MSYTIYDKNTNESIKINDFQMAYLKMYSLNDDYYLITPDGSKWIVKSQYEPWSSHDEKKLARMCVEYSYDEHFEWLFWVRVSGCTNVIKECITCEDFVARYACITFLPIIEEE